MIDGQESVASRYAASKRSLDHLGDGNGDTLDVLETKSAPQSFIQRINPIRFLKDRTPYQWLILALYYLSFYIVLGGLFAICSAVFFNIGFDITTPRYNNEQSLLMDSQLSRVNPSLGYRPNPRFDSNLIYFVSGAPESYGLYTENLKAFLASYTYEEGLQVDNKIRKDCTDDDKPDDIQACEFNVGVNLGDCGTLTTSYGYDKQAPCIFIKLNKVYGWEPVPYERCTTLDECKAQGLTDWEFNFLSKTFLTYANAVKVISNDAHGMAGQGDGNVVQQTTMQYNYTMADLFDGNNILVTCGGVQDADVDNIKNLNFVGEVKFHIHKKYFPFLNQRGYLPPVVAVKPLITRGTMVMFRCVAWAKNIIREDFFARDGAVHFEMMID